MELLNQKEYLKRYLSGNIHKKKKKHKKINSDSTKVKIIDDDIDISKLTSLEAAVDVLAANEDAPQIVGVIDERPMHLRIDDYRKSDLWKPIGSQIDTAFDNQPNAVVSKDKIVVKIQDKRQKHKDIGTSPKKSCKDEDISPLRRYTNKDSSHSHCKYEDSNNSPPKLKNKENDHVISRKRKDSDSSPQRRQHKDFNNSPPGRSVAHKDKSFPHRKYEDSDNSPPRLMNKENDHLANRKRKDSDNSPPRRSTVYKDSSLSHHKHEDSDNSPPRLKNKNKDSFRKRKDSNNSSSHYHQTHFNNSPPRQSMAHKNSSLNHCKYEDSDNSQPRHQQKDSNNSSSRWDTAPKDNSCLHRDKKLSLSNNFSQEGAKSKRPLLPGNKKGKYLIPAKRSMLDGKAAGLQSAQELVKENEAFRKHEDALFKTMPTEISGANASVVVRDRKTGKIRDFEKEAREKQEKEKEEAKDKEKYSRWGRGLKQVEDYENKMAEDLHEMSKPLARYADDEDLERFLKEQERDGDPMLDYIRKKRKKKIIETRQPVKPQFEGEFMPNRFGIVPGHRWDGVDRSNGYERKWIETQNAKAVQQEEIYRWSTEDM